MSQYYYQMEDREDVVTLIQRMMVMVELNPAQEAIGATQHGENGSGRCT